MAKSSEVIGIAAAVLILASKNPGGLSSPVSASLLKTVEIGSLINDFHRMTDIMNRMDNLGQMVLHPPQPPKLPPPTELFSKAMPDLSNIIDNIAPLMAAFGMGMPDQISQQTENDSF